MFTVFFSTCRYFLLHIHANLQLMIPQNTLGMKAIIMEKTNDCSAVIRIFYEFWSALNERLFRSNKFVFSRCFCGKKREQKC